MSSKTDPNDDVKTAKVAAKFKRPVRPKGFEFSRPVYAEYRLHDSILHAEDCIQYQFGVLNPPKRRGGRYETICRYWLPRHLQMERLYDRQTISIKSKD